jgi:hypothetical protein
MTCSNILFEIFGDFHVHSIRVLNTPGRTIFDYFHCIAFPPAFFTQGSEVL